MILGIMDRAKAEVLQQVLRSMRNVEGSTARPRWTGNEGKWSPERLREIRAEKGVGRPPRQWSERPMSQLWSKWQGNGMAARVNSARNLAEWERKPRPGKGLQPVPADVLRSVRRNACMSRSEFDKAARAKPETWAEIQTATSILARAMRRTSGRMAANVARENVLFRDMQARGLAGIDCA